MDGTLALGRFSEPGRRGPFDWSRVGEDDPNLPVISIVQALYCTGNKIIIMSGRSDVCRGDTSSWIKQHVGDFYERLLMRNDGDYRPDDVLKTELFNLHVNERYDVIGVIDDRDSVVSMWRARGLMCAQVAPGNF